MRFFVEGEIRLSSHLGAVALKDEAFLIVQTPREHSNRPQHVTSGFGALLVFYLDVEACPRGKGEDGKDWLDRRRMEAPLVGSFEEVLRQLKSVSSWGQGGPFVIPQNLEDNPVVAEIWCRWGEQSP